MSQRLQKIISVILFSIFFGLLEAIVVIHLREIFGAESLLTNHKAVTNDILFSLGFIAFLKPEASVLIASTERLLTLEQWREAATIIMLGTLAWAVTAKLKEKLAYFLLAFGIWDIFYYIFLRILVDWPKTLSDYDVFFLIPTPWVGPVATPLVLSLLLILISFFILKSKRL